MQYSVKFVKHFIVKQFKNSTHKILILSRIEKMVWVVLFCVTRLDFLKSHFKALNIPFKKVVLPGRVKCGGTEGEIMVAHGCRKRKKLICGTEGETVVAHGRLPSPARMIMQKLVAIDIEFIYNSLKKILKWPSMQKWQCPIYNGTIKTLIWLESGKKFFCLEKCLILIISPIFLMQEMRKSL